MKVLFLTTMEAMRVHEENKVRNFPVESAYVIDEPIGKYRGFFPLQSDIGNYTDTTEIDLVIYSADYELTEERVNAINRLKAENIPFMELHITSATGWEEFFLLDDGEGFLSLPDSALVQSHRVPHAKIYKVRGHKTNHELLSALYEASKKNNQEVPLMIMSYGRSKTFYKYLHSFEMRGDISRLVEEENLKVYQVIKEMTLLQAMVELSEPNVPRISFSKQTIVYRDGETSQGISIDFRKKD